MSKRSLDRKFAGSAVLLQEKMRQDPESYQEEFYQHLAHLESMVDVLKSNPAAVPMKATTDLIQTVSGVCSKMHGDSAQKLATHFIALLSPPVLTTLPSAIYRAVCQGLMLLRSRDLVPSAETLPVFLQLLAVQDKEARRMLLWHVSSDIAKSLGSRRNNHAESRRLQALMHDIVQQDDGPRSRYVLQLMIDLYRRQVWKDDLNVHFIAQAVFLKNTRTVKTALRFLLSRTYTLGTDSDDEEEKDPGKSIMNLKRQLRVRKKTRGRERKANAKVRTLAKKYHTDGNDSDGHDGADGKARRKETKLLAQHDPILLIRDPQEYAERVMAHLRRTTEKFDVRMLFMNVLSRLISTHELFVFPFYTYLIRYMEPYQRDVSNVLAYAVQSIHATVPPEELVPLVRTVANNFVNDKASADAITIGLNTIREICKRQPLVMDSTLLEDLVQYTNYREDKGVVMAARSLIRFFRAVQPDMLPVRERGKGCDLTKKMAQYGKGRAVETIDGFDLLVQHETTERGDDNGTTRCSVEGEVQEDSSDADDDEEAGSDEGSEESDGEEGELEEDDEEEELEDVEEDEGDSEPTDDDDEVDSDDDEVPQLVPVGNLNSVPGGSTAGTARTGISTLADRLLTPEDFAVMARLRKNVDHTTTRNKKMAAGKRDRDAYEAEVADIVDPSTLELHSSKKRHRDREEKIEKVREERNRHSISYKKSKKKGARTNAEKKKSKLAQMTRRSRVVGAKIRASQSTKNDRVAEAKKRNVKFRIHRGYGA